MAKLYEMHLRVPADLISPLLQLVEGSGIVVNMGQQGKPPTRRINRRYANGTRSKTMGGIEAVLHILKNGPASQAAIVEQMVGHGFAHSSASSRLSAMRNEGLVRKDGNVWSLTEKGVGEAK